MVSFGGDASTEEDVTRLILFIVSWLVLSLPLQAAVIIEPGDFTFSAFNPVQVNLDLGSNTIFGSFSSADDLDFIQPIVPVGTFMVSHELVALITPTGGSPDFILEVGRCNEAPGVACAVSVVDQLTVLPFDFGPPIDLIEVREIDCLGCQYEIRVEVAEIPSLPAPPVVMLVVLGLGLSLARFYSRS